MFTNAKSFKAIVHDAMTSQHTSVTGEQTLSSSHELSSTGETIRILNPPQTRRDKNYHMCACVQRVCVCVYICECARIACSACC